MYTIDDDRGNSWDRDSLSVAYGVARAQHRRGRTITFYGIGERFEFPKDNKFPLWKEFRKLVLRLK